MPHVKSLTPAPYNPRRINDKQLDMLGRSMREFGDLSGIVVNVRTGNLVGGHQRIKHFDPDGKITKKAQKDDTGTVARGYIETPAGKWDYREVDWPEDKEKAANLAANKHGGYFDFDGVQDILGELSDLNFDIEITGFDRCEMDTFTGEVFDGGGSGGPGMGGSDDDGNGKQTRECPACGHRW